PGPGRGGGGRRLSGARVRFGERPRPQPAAPPLVEAASPCAHSLPWRTPWPLTSHPNHRHIFNVKNRFLYKDLAGRISTSLLQVERPRKRSEDGRTGGHPKWRPAADQLARLRAALRPPRQACRGRGAVGEPPVELASAAEAEPGLAQPGRAARDGLGFYFGTGKLTTLSLPSRSIARTPKRKLSLVIPWTV